MKQIFYFILLCLIASCTEECIETASSELVVEGWIENGGFPVVILTRTFPVSTEHQNVEYLSDYLVKWAKVAIVNGEDTVVLTGKVDKGYYPSYIYTTSRMRGEVGKTYKLIIEYKNYYAEAETTIPEPAVIDSFCIKKCADSDTLYQINAYLRSSKTNQEYYQFFTRIGGKARQYQASFLGSVDNSFTDSNIEVPVLRGHNFNEKDYIPYYTANDSVAVKCCRLDAFGYSFWNSFIKSSYMLSSFMPINSNLPSNINGGMGYWCGYGSTTSYFIIRDYVKPE